MVPWIPRATSVLLFFSKAHILILWKMRAFFGLFRSFVQFKLNSFLCCARISAFFFSSTQQIHHYECWLMYSVYSYFELNQLILLLLTITVNVRLSDTGFGFSLFAERIISIWIQVVIQFTLETLCNVEGSIHPHKLWHFVRIWFIICIACHMTCLIIITIFRAGEYTFHSNSVFWSRALDYRVYMKS